MRRRKLIAALVALAVLVVVGAPVLWPPPNRVTQENYDSIRMGMSRTEVEAIFGAPGDYTSGPTDYRVDTAPQFASTAGYTFGIWNTDTSSVGVVFDAEDRVSDSWFCVGKRLEQGALDNLLWRAKRQWRRWFPE
jgi:hypothetical protein